MKNFKITIAFTLVAFMFITAHPAHARFPVRFGGNLGLWWGSFSETFGSTTTTSKVSSAWGLGARFGFPFKLFYVDYTPTYAGLGHVSSTNSDSTEAYYFAPIGFEFGFSGLHDHDLPPIEAFVGIDYGSFAFTSGTQTKTKGEAYKLGAAYYPFHFGKYQNLGFRAEYRKHSLTIDNHGALPGLSTSLSSYYIGIIYLFDSYLKKEDAPKTE